MMNKTISGDPIRTIIESKIMLAPMSGITDAPFRIIARKYGCRFAFTEMIDVSAVYFKSRRNARMVDWSNEDTPLAIQIVGQDIEKILYAANYAEEKGYSLIDFNAACPARKVVKGGKGSALMRETLRFAKIIETLAGRVKVPITVKIRSGWDDLDKNYLQVAKIAESSGAKAVSIHPRTKEQMYKGKPDYSVIREIKENLKIPVFGSGNIFSSLDVENIIKETGCDAVHIARGALGKPWIFEDTYNYFKTGEAPRKRTFDEIKKAMGEHMALNLRYNGIFRNKCSRAYKNIAWYLKGYKNLDEVMKAYIKIDSEETFAEFLRQLRIDENNRLRFDDGRV
ncbi:MAG: tRNA dihydrouridine synthase DusB [Candidatus Omnitrophica bacterium]|nr:tRNA dihydrouridine synthase DusB [Candidatus Omnitrophota bacterium]